MTRAARAEKLVPASGSVRACIDRFVPLASLFTLSSAKGRLLRPPIPLLAALTLVRKVHALSSTNFRASYHFHRRNPLLIWSGKLKMYSTSKPQKPPPQKGSNLRFLIDTRKWLEIPLSHWK